MKIKDLIKELEILQVKYGQDAKVFTFNEVGSISELLETGICVAIHENELKIILDS